MCVRARERKICYRRFVIAVSLELLCSSYLRPSYPEGVLLADAAGGESEGMSFLFHCVILCAFTPGPAETALARVRVCTVILASARIACGDTTLALFLFFFAYFSIALVITEIEKEILNKIEYGDIAVRWKCQQTTLLRPFNVFHFPTCLLHRRNYHVIRFSYLFFSFAA